MLPHLLLGLLGGVLAAAPTPQAGELPFEALGNELLAQARPELAQQEPEESSLDGRLRRRLAGVHRRAPLGAFELWIPVATIESPGRITDGPAARDLRAHALDLVALQRLWLGRVGLGGEALARAQADLDTIEGWARGLRKKELPELSSEVRQALARIEHVLLSTPESERVASRTLQPLAIVVAPTRTHYAALLGATGIELAGLRETLWTDLNARTMNQFPTWRMTYIGLTLGAGPNEGPALLDGRHDPKELRQTIVHLGSLLLTYNVSSDLDAWLSEGLAISDTIDVAGADETVFSGRRRTDSDRALSQLSTIFGWIYKENSPYREGPSKHRFLRELKKAHGRDGFEIHDLVQGGVGLHVRGPFLGPDRALPDGLLEGPPGVRNGYAEFLRAYSAAFVHWLATTHDVGVPATRLDRLVSNLRERCMGISPPPRRPLAPAAATALGRTLGTASDPAKDLEAEFLAWLVGGAQ